MSNPPERPHTPGPEERLDSWKDIAAYLQRDVSTVQRWEKREGMPVHRHVHDKLGSVYAFRSELDAWRSRSATVSRQTQPLDGWWTKRRLVILGSTLVAISAAAAVAVMLRDTQRLPTSTADDLLQRARYLSVRTTDADSQGAIELLERAITVDPSSARAHAELASAYVTRLAYVTPDETRELEEKAFASAEKALALDPNVPEAYLARGDLLWTSSNRFAHERAVQQFRRALALNPQLDQAHRRLARVFVHLGFFDEARHHADLALAINPSNAQALNSRAQSILWSGHDEEALAILLSIPGPVLPELVEANTVFALHRLGRRDEARSQLIRAVDKYKADPSGNLRGIEAVLLAEADPLRAEELIAGVRQRTTANPSHHAAYFAAAAMARMRQAQEAVRWLREASATGFPCYALFEIDANLDPIRQDPAFQSFMEEAGKASLALTGALFTDAR